LFRFSGSTRFESGRPALPTAAARIEVHEPAHLLRHSELGMKLSKVSGAFDWSVSYFPGFGLLPTVRTGEPLFELYYAREQVFGADCARNFGRVGFRSEVAFSMPEAGRSVDPNASRRRLFWVNGVDRTFLDNLNLNFQLFVRWMPHFEKPDVLVGPNPQTVGGLNGIIRGQEAGVSSGVTFRISKLWVNDTLRAELFAVTNFRRGDYYLRPLVTYDINDLTRVLIGANLYGGPQDTQYGLLGPASGALVEIRHSL